MVDVTKDITKRMNYFDRQFLRAKDFQDEQDYHIDRRWRHNRLLHMPGVADGLEVTLVNSKSVKVSKGTAIDSLGREMVLANESLPIPVPTGVISSYVDIVIYYSETSTNNSTDPGISGPTRIEETPSLKPVPAGQAYPANAVALARVAVDVNGDFGAITESGVRVEAGISLINLELTNLEVEKLTIKAPSGTIPSVPSTEWPIFTCTKSKEAALNGDIKALKLIGEGSSITNLSGNEIKSGTVAAGYIDSAIARESRFDPTTGHQHKGIGAGDGPKISHGDLINLSGANPSSTDPTKNKHVSDAQARDWDMKLNGRFVVDQISIAPGTNQIVTIVDSVNLMNKLIFIKGWATTNPSEPDGAPSLLPGNHFGVYEPVVLERWAINKSAAIDKPLFSIISGSAGAMFTINIMLRVWNSQTSLIISTNSAATQTVGYSFMVLWS